MIDNKPSKNEFARPLRHMALGLLVGALFAVAPQDSFASGSDCESSPTCHPHLNYTAPGALEPCSDAGCESAMYICCLF